MRVIYGNILAIPDFLCVHDSAGAVQNSASGDKPKTRKASLHK